MRPLVEELRSQYAGKLEVVMVLSSTEQAKAYQTRYIPASIFLDSNRNEVSRVTGAMTRQAVLAEFAKLGVR